MEVKEITNQQLLDKFVGSQGRAQFLQSWPWGEFQHTQQNKIIRLGIFDEKNLLGSAQIIEQVLPLGKKYWYCPRGPIINDPARHSLREGEAGGQLPMTKFQAVFETLLEGIVSRAERQNAMFLKIEPPLEKHSQQLFDGLAQKHEMKSAHFVQPPDSWYLELEKSEQELLASMHQKTRYNIRLAERKGVTVRTANMIDDFETFWRLMKATVKRDKFRSHSRAYYHDMYRQLVQTDFMKMFMAELNGKIIAANMVVFFGDTVTYIHGATSDKYRNVMAPHLLQWRQIQAAKKEGFKYYDFWGVQPQKTQKEDESTDGSSWQGITRFKRGFDGFEINFIGTYDLILDKFWYKIYKIAKEIRGKY